MAVGTFRHAARPRETPIPPDGTAISPDGRGAGPAGIRTPREGKPPAIDGMGARAAGAGGRTGRMDNTDAELGYDSHGTWRST